ncbi:MAG: HAD-IIB family hydrolase [Spirochaetes bacterium]|nr:HAD-IIB family hydrolase [Spirochaetota bacterium]
MLKKNIKLIAFDLDGTLLNDNMMITDNTKRGLQKIIINNIICIIISSRSLNNIKNIITDIDFNYLSCCNGSLIYNNRKDVIEECSFIGNLSKEIIYMLNENDIIINIYCKDNTFTNRLSCKKNNNYYQKSLKPSDFNDYNDEDILMIEIIDENNKFVKMLNKKRLKKYNDFIKISYSGYSYYQITRKNIDKAYSLELISRKLNISPDNTIAIGDSETDLKMLQYSKYGILMKNKCNLINKNEFIITEYDNNNDGAIRCILENLNL